MNQARLAKRIIRRETHSSPARLSVATAAVLLAACLWLGTESTLSLLGQPALLASPGDVARLLAGVPKAVLPAGRVAGGAFMAVAGAAFLLAAVKGGRRGRRSMDSDRTALVVDDEAIAAALARKVRLAGNLAPEQVATTVTRSCALANVRPTSGVPLERNVLAEAAAGEVVSLRLHKKLAVEVRVAAEGAVGR